MKANLEKNAASAIERPRSGEPYLLTPGPLTTAYSVKEKMLRDWGSWDGDFRAMTARLRAELLSLVGKGADEFDCVPIQGSGTFVVEAMLGSLLPLSDNNGVSTSSTFRSLKNVLISDSKRARASTAYREAPGRQSGLFRVGFTGLSAR
jgi:hypothetical protein